MRLPLLLITLCMAGGSFLQGQIPEIKRRLPPESELVLPESLTKKIEDQLLEYEDRTFYLKGSPYEADVSVFSEAVRLAMRHNEFYNKIISAIWFIRKLGFRSPRRPNSD